MTEAMAQVGAVGVMADESYRRKLALFAGIDGVRFRRQVVPGDVLRMEVEITRLKGSIGRGNGSAGSVPAETANRVVMMGELGLDGRVRPVRGILPGLLAAQEAGFDVAVVPASQVR